MSNAQPTASLYRWHDDALELVDWCETTELPVLAADSWLVTHGTARALALHRERFATAIADFDVADFDAFWDVAIAMIPRDGDWFPRVELRSRAGIPELAFRLRSAPERTRSAVLATHVGADPRTQPERKGPDLAALQRARSRAQSLGATEIALLSPDGFVVEGGYSALVWWRGAILCMPPADFERIDSVTARSLVGVASVLGVEIFEEAVTPAELDGVELWALNALHGIRIVTEWIDGPSLAEEPGRLQLWRSRLDALRHPLA